MSTSYELVKTIATTLIRGTNASGQPLTRAIIEQHADSALAMNDQWRAEVNRDALIKDLETQCDVWIGSAQALDDETGHVPWLPKKRATVEWQYWTRYKQLLAPSWAVKSVDGLDQVTDDILSRLEDP